MTATLTPKRKAELDQAKVELDAFLSKCGKDLDYLAARWSDEQEYEDFAAYETRMRGYCEGQSTITFVRATKQPFGFVVKHSTLPDRKIAFTVTRNAIRWKLV